ncbi:hypothetical protein [Sphingosinicella sp. BN140058]|uniref:DUF6980 family protein n=1 Tax=Sphingosinicella sp. BN140058 TaxID=1892855 RepID=UPI00198015E0|nr:hypothetical protein [Sphingosinicella sp. BN140058]
MAGDLNRTCDRHSDRSDCPDALIARLGDGSYGLIIHDGGSSVMAIAFCPWCGTRLPEGEEEVSGDG